MTYKVWMDSANRQLPTDMCRTLAMRRTRCYALLIPNPIKQKVVCNGGGLTYFDTPESSFDKFHVFVLLYFFFSNSVLASAFYL